MKVQKKNKCKKTLCDGIWTKNYLKQYLNTSYLMNCFLFMKLFFHYCVIARTRNKPLKWSRGPFSNVLLLRNLTKLLLGPLLEKHFKRIPLALEFVNYFQECLSHFTKNTLLVTLSSSHFIITLCWRFAIFIFLLLNMGFKLSLKIAIKL
jgi:hypothetical protein